MTFDETIIAHTLGTYMLVFCAPDRKVVPFNFASDWPTGGANKIKKKSDVPLTVKFRGSFRARPRAWVPRCFAVLPGIYTIFELNKPIRIIIISLNTRIVYLII